MDKYISKSFGLVGLVEEEVLGTSSVGLRPMGGSVRTQGCPVRVPS